jgi:hypothetical protein
MWIVRLVFRRPYTFVVMATLILMGMLAIVRTPTDLGLFSCALIGATLPDSSTRQTSCHMPTKRMTAGQAQLFTLIVRPVPTACTG